MPGTNLVGPFGTGVNESYDLPDFGDSGGTEFSWFVDCSDDVTPDGTRFTAQWANRMMLLLRRAVVGMGIPLNETNGNSLLDAIMRAHRPIVNIGGGAAIHKGEKMPEWQHELRSIVGAGTVTVNVVGDTIVITGASGSSVTLQNLGAGVPVYKGISGSVHQFRSLMAEAGIAVVAGANEATFRLAPIPGWSIMLRNGASADVPTGVAIDELTEVTNPALADWLMLQRNPGRELRKVKVENIRGQLWEIASQTLVSSPVTDIELTCQANKYSELKLVLDDLAFSAPGSGTDCLEVCLLNGSTALTRKALFNSVDEGASQITRIYQASGQISWQLSDIGNRAVLERSADVYDVYQEASSSNPPPQSSPLGVFPMWHKQLGVGNGTYLPEHAVSGSTPPDRVRLRHRDITSLFNNTGSSASFTAGRATLYGLKRA